MLATLRHRDFALLWFAGLVSVAGDFALIAALPLHAYTLTGSAAAAGGVFAAMFLPRVLLGSVAGVYVDRWDRKRTMVAADLLRAVLVLPLLAVASSDLLWILYLVRVATEILGLFFAPAESALLPRLVSEDQLVAANALNALNNNLGRLIGPAVGGALYAAGGLGAVAVIDAASFVISASLIALIRAGTRPDRGDLSDGAASAPGHLLGELLAGLRVVGQSHIISAVFLSLGVGLLGEGVFEVGFAPLVLDTFQGGASGAGILLSAQAVGGLIAGALVARFAQSLPPRLLFAGGLIGLGFADLGMVNAARFAAPGASTIAVAAAFMVLAGFPVVALNAAATAILQTAIADLYRGRVFGALSTIQGISVLSGLVLGALAIPRYGPEPVLSAGALMWMVGGIVAQVSIPSGAGTAPPDAPSSTFVSPN